MEGMTIFFSVIFCYSVFEFEVEFEVVSTCMSRIIFSRCEVISSLLSIWRRIIRICCGLSSDDILYIRGFPVLRKNYYSILRRYYHHGFIPDICVKLFS